MSTLRASLEAGHLIVVRCPSGPTIEEARDAGRRASTWLQQCTDFAGVRLSRSATQGLAVVAAHRSSNVGIDVETACGDNGFAGMESEVLHSAEAAQLATTHSTNAHVDVWVRKEAVLKAFGVGLAVSPAAICTGSYSPGWEVVSHPILGTAWVRSVDTFADVAMAVAITEPVSGSLKIFDFVD